MPGATSGPEVPGLSKLKMLVSDQSEPCVGIRSCEPKGSLDGVDGARRSPFRDAAVLDGVR